MHEMLYKFVYLLQ